MKGKWFRFYDEALDDPKVQRLDPALFRTWVNLLCLASRHDGILPVDQIPFALRQSEAEISAAIETLVGAGLLDTTPEGLSPHNWRGRQYKSDRTDPTNAQRQQGFRDRKAKVTAGKPLRGRLSNGLQSQIQSTETEAETQSPASPSVNPNKVSPSLRSGSSPASGDAGEPVVEIDPEREIIREAARYYQAKAIETKERKDPCPWTMIRAKDGKLQLEGDRVRKIRLRLKELGGLEDWRAMIDRAFASSWIAGKQGRSAGHEGWCMSFDFVLSPSGCMKIAEGKFDDTKGSKNRRMSGAAWAGELDEWLKEQADGKRDRTSDGSGPDTGAATDGPRTIDGTLNHPKRG